MRMSPAAVVVIMASKVLTRHQKRVHAVVEKDYFWQKRLNAAIQLPVNLQDLHQIEGIPRKRIFLAITKARFYTWGESTLGKLGHSYPITGSAVRSHRVPRGVAIPLEIRSLRNVFVVDIKIGYVYIP